MCKSIKICWTLVSKHVYCFSVAQIWLILPNLNTNRNPLIEQEHSMKIDALRKSLEEQVKQLQVQIQEAEAAALLGGKRVIAKLETRIRDLETALDEESRRHKETQNALRKKDRRIKEVQMQVDEEHKVILKFWSKISKYAYV